MMFSRLFVVLLYGDALETVYCSLAPSEIIILASLPTL